MTEINETKNQINMDSEEKLKKEWYLIPNTKVDNGVKYDFELLNWKADGLIFAVTVVLFPLISSLMFTFIFGMQSNTSLQLTQMGVTILSTAIGFFVTFQRTGKLFWNEGIGLIYLYILIPIGTSFLSAIILSVAYSKSGQVDTIVSNFTSIGSQMIGTIIFGAIALKLDKAIWERIKMTFVNNWKLIIIVCLVGFIVLFGISNGIFTLLWNKLLNINDTSDNQEALGQLVHNPNLSIAIPYCIMLGVYTIIVAPFVEEVATRHSLFINSGNQWLGFVLSTVYFGFIHFGQTGDFIHAATYLSAGACISLLFQYCRGNFVYTWLTHAIYNGVAFTFMIVGIG